MKSYKLDCVVYKYHHCTAGFYKSSSSASTFIIALVALKGSSQETMWTLLNAVFVLCLVAVVVSAPTRRELPCKWQNVVLHTLWVWPSIADKEY